MKRSITCWSPDYNIYMDIQQRINFALLDKFASLGH